jgi:rfaE bifunctional protein kinase chain/domain
MIKAGNFSSVRALVVGDVMLDRYLFGEVERISPEAPVPVLSVSDEEERVGGAGNVACNVVALGGQCRLLSVIGDDAAGKSLLRIVRSAGVEPHLHVENGLSTTVKLRMVARNQQLLRADFETEPDGEVLKRCLGEYGELLADSDVVILSDYGKGGLQHVSEMIALAREASVPVVIDPKGADFSRYKWASLVTPNLREFEAVAGSSLSEDEFRMKAEELRAGLELDALLVTRSEKGMCLFSEGGTVINSPARARDVYDVSGAGDTVIAVLGLATAAGMPDEERLVLANTVAGLVVSKFGTAAASESEVIAALNEEAGK